MFLSLVDPANVVFTQGTQIIVYQYQYIAIQGGGTGNSDVVNVGMFHPFTAIFSGPTQCGNTDFIIRFIEDVEELMFAQPERIVHCCGEYQSIFAEYPQVELREGRPTFSDFDGRRRMLLIIDDFMNEIGTDLSKIFTIGTYLYSSILKISSINRRTAER